MFTVKPLHEFTEWISGLKDSMTRVRLNRRLDRVAAGNMGDFAPVGEGVFELREDFGAGWRMYYIKRGNTVIVMLGGGNKSGQQRDINKAIALSKTIED